MKQNQTSMPKRPERATAGGVEGCGNPGTDRGRLRKNAPGPRGLGAACGGGNGGTVAATPGTAPLWIWNDYSRRNFWMPKKNVASFDKGSKI